VNNLHIIVLYELHN